MDHRSVEQAVASLNPRQREAAETLTGPLLIVAGAGSGKTRTLTVRVAWLIAQGASPSSILGVTFTNKAAREMRERVESLLPGVGGGVTLTTFHSLCAQFLRRWGDRLGYPRDFTIYDADDQEKLIKRVAKELDLDIKKHSASFLLGQVSNAKNDLLGPEEYEPAASMKEILKPVYEKYQSALVASGAMDFDDLLFQAWRLLSGHPEVLENLQRRYRHFLVDEYQDTNFAQYKLISLLSRDSGNLCVVGDEDQSIYGWRGANIRNILEFEKDFPGAKVVVLDQNYRSTQRILDAASAVIARNSGPRKKHLWSEMKGGEPLSFFHAEDDREEAERVAREIERQHLNDGVELGKFAVLFRMNSQSRQIEQALVKRRIPYEITGGVKFFGRKEVKDVLAYLRILVNPRDEVSLRRIINTPSRGIGDTTVDRLAGEAGSLWEAVQARATGPKPGKIAPFVELMHRLKERADEGGIFAVAQDMLEKTAYLQYLKDDDPERADDRVGNIDSLLSDMKLQEQQTPDLTLAQYLENAALHADADDLDERAERVHLLTLHNAKGLEFPIVFMMGMEEGIFPHASSKDLPEELEEERRLAYVGMTRAMKRLYITAARRRMVFGQYGYNPLSRFIGEIPTDLFGRDRPPSMIPGSFGRAPANPFAASDEHRSDDGPSSQEPFSIHSHRRVGAGRPTLPGTAGGASGRSFGKPTSASFSGGTTGSGTTSGPATSSPNLPTLASFTRKPVTSEDVQKGVAATMLNVKPGVEVFHAVFGPGRIESVEGATLTEFRVTASFAKAGRKTLLLQYANLRVINTHNPTEMEVPSC